MWDTLVRVPRGSYNPRKFSAVLATFLVACFGYIFAVAPTAHAASALWSGDTVVYQDRTYERVDSDSNFPSDIKASPAIYRHDDTTRDPNLVYFIYFNKGVTQPKDEKEAVYVRYTLNPPNRFINETGKKTIDVEPVTTEDPAEGDGFLTGNCTIEGIGYAVCPAMNGIAEGMDFVYKSIRGFLQVQAMTTNVNNPIYRIWIVMRDLANIAFVIGFLVIIYSYLVGGGFNGYEIRKILPRIVVAATLINLSYILCAVAVDASNIAGYSVNQLFETVRDQTLSGSDTGVTDVNWTSVTAWVLAGGGGAIAASKLLPGVTGGTTTFTVAKGLWMLLSPFLVGGALLVMITFFILAARQAIIYALIAVAPLAFAAYILPNTEKWFEKWRSLFFTMLIMFPAFGAVFGASQLAGDAIIRMAKTTGSIEQVILGLGVMVAPLAITPLLLRLGGGVLNRFAGIINDPKKGIRDRYKNYTKERLDEQRAKTAGLNAEMLAAGSFRRRQFARRRSAQNFAKKNYRAEQKKQDEERAMNAWHQQSGRWGYDNSDKRDGDPLDPRDPNRNRFTRMAQEGYGNLDTYKRDNQLRHSEIDAHHKSAYDKQFDSSSDNFSQARYETRGNTYKYGQVSKRADARFETDISELEAGQADAVLAKLTNADTKKAMEASLGKFSVSLQDLNREISVEGDRKGLAEKQIQGQIAGALKANKIKINGQNIREYAAGIDENGATKVYARATAEMTKLHMENVDAVSSIYSNEGYELPELFTVIEGGKMRDGSKASDIQVHSAIKELFTKKGNNWAAQKMLDYTATLGMKYDSKKNGFVDINGELLKEEEVNNRRDFQQIVKEYASQSPLKVDYLSATERTRLETGTYMAPAPGKMKSETMILADAAVGKFDQQRILNADVDVLQRMVQVFRDPQNVDAIGETGRKNLLDQIIKVQSNPQINASIKDRERGVMNALASYLDKSDTRTSEDKENYFWYVLDENGNKVRASESTLGAQREKISVQAPQTYTFTQPFDS